MKKLILTVLCLVLLCGCSSMLNGSADHTEAHATAPDKNPNPMSIDVSSYYDLRQALLSFVANHEDEGIVRFSAYNGDMEADLNKACIYVTNDSALGSYSVSYIGSSLNRIVSYYEATVNIIYKRTASEINSIIDVDGAEQVRQVIRDMLDHCGESAAIRTDGYSINQDTFRNALTGVYYDDPKLIVALPEMTLNQYTDAYGNGRIYQVKMTYPESSPVMLGKRKAFDTALEQIGFNLTETDDEAYMLYQLCTYMAENVRYEGDISDEEYDRSAAENTAYGALYQRNARSEGIAMAMKLLCNWKNIDCVVVVGRYNNHIHAWNIIKVGGDWYHFDLTRMSSDPSESLMLNDGEIKDSYSWDTGAYPPCTGVLDYTLLTESVPISESEEE